MTLQLVAPAERFRETFVRALREFQNEGLRWWFGGDLEIAGQDFPAFVAKKLLDANRSTEAFVPKTHLWAIEDERFVGRISIHHHLTDALRLEGANGLHSFDAWAQRTSFYEVSGERARLFTVASGSQNIHTHESRLRLERTLDGY